MTKVLAISNHKGGVGKTTSSVNIGAGLASKKKKVLLIDLDPQANMGQSLGIEEAPHTIYGALKGEHDLKPFEVTKNLDIVPSHLDLASVEIEIASRVARELILKKLVDKVKSNYDFVIIDCPPSLGLITINAFAAADAVLIPLQSQFLALHGVDKLMEIVNLVQENINDSLELGGVFITQYDKRKVLNRDIAISVADHFGDKLFKTVIRDNIALAEAPSTGLDIFRYDNKSHGAADYGNLVSEIIKRFK